MGYDNRIHIGDEKGDYRVIRINRAAERVTVICKKCGLSKLIPIKLFNELDNPRCENCSRLKGVIDKRGYITPYGLEIVKELGENKVIARCTAHGHKEVYNKASLLNGSTKYCKVCKQKGYYIEQEHKSDTDLKVGDTKGTLTIISISSDKQSIEVQCNKCGRKGTRKYNSFKYSENPKCKYCSDGSNFKSIKGQTIGKLNVIIDQGGGVVVARCTECGAVGEYNKSRLTTKGYKCICCDKKNSALYKSQVGKVFNGLLVLDEVEEDGGIMAVVECVDCQHKAKVSKGSLITLGQVCSKCKDEPKSGLCPKCKAHIRFKRNKSKCKCSHCGTEFSKELIAAPVDFAYRLYKNEQKYGAKNSRVVGSMQLLNYKYKGRDELIYFNAVCLDHNRKVVASMNEAKTGVHDVCESEFEM